MNGLSRALRERGMSMNAKRSAGFTITKDEKRKCLVIIPKEY